MIECGDEFGFLLAESAEDSIVDARLTLENMLWAKGHTPSGFVNRVFNNPSTLEHRPLDLVQLHRHHTVHFVAQDVDKRVLQLIGRYLRAGLMQEGVTSPRREGTPQGGPLSPLLSNILLDDLDKELERRGHRFVRYADDCNVYVQSRAAGERVMRSLETWLECHLRLRINRTKSAVARPWKRTSLATT